MFEKQLVRVLIVDDEKPARRDIRRMLEKIPGLEISGEASDGLDAVKKIRKLRPDLVLLDIQMPGLDGFQVIAKLRSHEDLPSIVFITAYDQYALKAFEVHAVDYLTFQITDRVLGDDRCTAGTLHVRRFLEFVEIATTAKAEPSDERHRCILLEDRHAEHPAFFDILMRKILLVDAYRYRRRFRSRLKHHVCYLSVQSFTLS